MSLPNRPDLRWEATDDPNRLRAVVTHPDGTVTKRTVLCFPVGRLEDEEAEDLPALAPAPPRLWTRLLRWLAVLCLPISYFLWRLRLKRTAAANLCPHADKDFRQTILLEGHPSVVTGALVCALCLEAHFAEDIRRICGACHGPIWAGSWVNTYRIAGQARLVHHDCSGERWGDGIWTGSDLYIPGHGI